MLMGTEDREVGLGVIERDLSTAAEVVLRCVAETAVLERGAGVGDGHTGRPAAWDVENPPTAARRLRLTAVDARRPLAGGGDERGPHRLYRVLHVQPARVERFSFDRQLVDHLAKTQAEREQRLDARKLLDRLLGQIDRQLTRLAHVR